MDSPSGNMKFLFLPAALADAGLEVTFQVGRLVRDNSLWRGTGSLNDLQAEAVLTIQRGIPGWQDFDPFYPNTAMRSYNINVRAHTIDINF